MVPIFDDNGHATKEGSIICYHYDAKDGEYLGESEEFVNVGVSIPAMCTLIAPGDPEEGKVYVFRDGKWESADDFRGKTVYSTESGAASIVDYIGSLREGFTYLQPATPYDKWNGKSWVKDSKAEKAAAILEAENQKQWLMDNASMTISNWKAELELGIISDEDKESLKAWLLYIKQLKAVDTSVAPKITWPEKPSL